jgi:hypothetical protein
MAPAFAWAWHLPNNYANNLRSPLGKVRMDSLFFGTEELGKEGSSAPMGTRTLSQCAGTNDPGGGEPSAEGPEIEDEIGFASDGESGAPTASRGDTKYRQRYYLVSHHDTILYVDAEFQLLRHAPFGIAPMNLVLEIAGLRGRLLMTGKSASDIRQVSFAQSGIELHTQVSRADLDCHVETFADDNISILSDKHYLGADLDGVVHSKTWCRDWERYRLVRADTLDGLSLLRRYCWLSHTDRRIISLAAQPIDFGRDRPAESSALAATLAPHAIHLRRELIFGPARLRLVGKDPVFRADESESRDRDLPAKVHIQDASGLLHEFSRFTPLVYYIVYGHESYYECLHLSLTSLERYGCFNGTIGVACDRPLDELIKYIPETFRHRLIVSEASKDRDPFSVEALQQPLYDKYQPILCCDVGIVFDASITDVLIDILFTGRICRASHPGVVGFESVTRIRELYGAVRNVEAGLNFSQPQSPGDEQVIDIVPKSGADNFDVLERYCQCAAGQAPLAERRGLAEFCSGSGAADVSAKVSIMTSYLGDLNLAATREHDTRQIELNLSIPGGLDTKELEQLARLARRVPPNGCIVEIGSLFGLSSWTLAKNTSPGVTIYCLDLWAREPWMSLEAFKNNISGFSNIVPLRGQSPRDFIGWRRSINLFFCNGVGANPALHQNLVFWRQFLVPGGWICGHNVLEQFSDVKAEVDWCASSLGAQAEVTAGLWSMRVPNRHWPK